MKNLIPADRRTLVKNSQGSKLDSRRARGASKDNSFGITPKGGAFQRDVSEVDDEAYNTGTQFFSHNSYDFDYTATC